MVERNRQREMHGRVKTLADAADLRAAVEGYRPSSSESAPSQERRVGRVAFASAASRRGADRRRRGGRCGLAQCHAGRPPQLQLGLAGRTRNRSARDLGEETGSDGVVKVAGAVFRVVVAPLKLAGHHWSDVCTASLLDQRTPRSFSD